MVYEPALTSIVYVKRTITLVVICNHLLYASCRFVQDMGSARPVCSRAE